MKIIAVVVTYNRKALLSESLQALMAQTSPLDEIVVLDNASTDGTQEMLQEAGLLAGNKIKYIRKESNTGGAGGFYYGSKQAYDDGADWIWMMDDDCIPTPTALEELVKASEIVDASFLSSAVYNSTGVPHNPAALNTREYWYKYIDDEMLSITEGSFVSFFMCRAAVEKCGLPYKGFFIWHDDIEYSKRLVRYYKPAYFVGKSKVVHKNSETSTPMTDKANINRIRRLHYGIRNSLVVNKAYGTFSSRVSIRYMYFKWIIQSLFKEKNYRFLRAFQVLKGFGGFWFGTYNRKEFKKRFKNHLADTNK